MAKRRKDDAKSEALRECGTLHARPEDVTDPLFNEDPFFDPRDMLQVKYEMLRRVRVDGESILPVSRAFGLSRPTFYETQAAFERGGLSGLLPEKRGPRRAHKLSTEVMAFVEDLLGRKPEIGAGELARRILARFRMHVHPRSIERALERSKKA